MLTDIGGMRGHLRNAGVLPECDFLPPVILGLQGAQAGYRAFAPRRAVINDSIQWLDQVVERACKTVGNGLARRITEVVRVVP